MFSKEELEDRAKKNAFEYDLKWWNTKTHRLEAKPKNGDIVAFMKSRNVYNGVLALYGQDSAVIFYATPHDVADEEKYSWVAPVFRVEIMVNYVFPVPENAKAIDLNDDMETTDFAHLVETRVHRTERVLRELPPLDNVDIDLRIAPTPPDILGELAFNPRFVQADVTNWQIDRTLLNHTNIWHAEPHETTEEPVAFVNPETQEDDDNNGDRRF